MSFWLILHAITPQNILPSQSIPPFWSTDLLTSPINYLEKQKGTWTRPEGKKNVDKISKLRINSHFLVGQNQHSFCNRTEHSFPTSTTAVYTWNFSYFCIWDSVAFILNLIYKVLPMKGDLWISVNYNNISDKFDVALGESSCCPLGSSTNPKRNFQGIWISF